MSSSPCELVLTTVRMEVTPSLLHELCFDNYSVTLVVKCDKIWFEDILDFCSTVGLHSWDVPMNELSISSPLTLQLVKSGRVVDSSSLNINTDHLVHGSISVLGDHKSRFVLAVKRVCSTFRNNTASAPELYISQKSGGQVSQNQPITTAKQSSQNPFSHQENGITDTTAEHLTDTSLLMRYNISDGMLKSSRPVQMAQNVDYTSQSLYFNDRPDNGGDHVKHDKISSIQQRKGGGYLSDISQVETSEIQSTGVIVFTSRDTLRKSNYAAHQDTNLDTLAIAPTLYPEIEPHRVTSSSKYMLKSDEPNTHFHFSSIVLEHITQHINETYRKHNTDNGENPRKRRKRNTDKKLELPSEFSEKHPNVPAQMIEVTHAGDSLETIKQMTHSGPVAFESNSADSTKYTLVKAEASDFVLSTHSNNIKTLSTDEQPLNVPATDIPLFPSLYATEVNLDGYTDSAYLSNSMLSEHTLHEEYEIQSASLMHNSVYSQVYNSPALEGADNKDLTLDIAALSPSETLWIDIRTSVLRTSAFSNHKDDQTSKVKSTYEYFDVSSSQSLPMAENNAMFLTVPSTHLLESEPPPTEANSDQSEDGGYDQESASVLSVLSSSFSDTLESEFSHVTSLTEFPIEEYDLTDTPVISSLTYSYFTMSNSRETNIHPDPLIIDSTVSQTVDSSNVYIYDLSSSTDIEASSLADHTRLHSTTPPLIEQATPERKLTTLPLMDFATPLIQLTQSSFGNLNNVYTTVEYSGVINHTATPIHVTLITSQRSGVNPLTENTGVISLTSDRHLWISESDSIASSAAHQRFIDASHASVEATSVTKSFTVVRDTPPAVTKPEETWKPPAVTTPSRNSSTNVTPLARQDNSAGLDDDTMWPVVAALVIGIPAIIVLGIAVTVIHRNRRQDPGKFFTMRTLNSSSQSSIATPRHDISQQSSVDV
ncbi:hypothetical protein BsWGS_00552 [Bradybaena similaris]